MNTPEISIIMSVYNGETYLEEAIESVRNQTFLNWELIVINDCSQDSTGEILAALAAKDARIKVHPNEVNLKLPKSLNKAISLSSGKYIARMDADDICLPDRLEKQYRFMEENPGVALSSCRFMTMKNGVFTPGGVGGRCDNEAVRALLLVGNPILHPGVIARAEVMKQLNYDTTLTCTEDLELWTRMAMGNLKMEILPEFLMLYRLHDKQITSTTLARQHTEVLKIQEKYYGTLLEKMDEATQQFYISSVYFTETADVGKFLAYAKWLKRVSAKHFDKNSISYVLLETLAEYKRFGVKKSDIVKAMLRFNPFFLAKELMRRKKMAKKDIDKCHKIAVDLGLKQTSGIKEFPIFEK
ncbi:MAG: glycosyltransferase family 2 protein [Ruminococcaceae bacterium]|nr:glycosyltransferase family 2 protein [Oscillospiraceae bacterium]